MDRESGTAAPTEKQNDSSPGGRTLQIGIVPYLNVQPLIWAFSSDAGRPRDAGVPEVTILPETPRRLAAGLRGGHYDAAIVPVFEYLQNPSYRIVPDICIGCYGPVASVVLFSNTPLGQLRTILLDQASLTSVNLLRVLLAERGLAPEYRDASGAGTETDGETLQEGTGRLLIGDPALRSRGRSRFEYDLGTLWRDLTGLPFVFAAWLVREGLLERLLSRTLQHAARKGFDSLERVADETAELFGFSPTAALAYFRENIRYEMGDAERAGVEEFARLCQKHGLIRECPPLRFAATGD